MPDHLTRALVPSANLRAVACITTDTVAEACRRHQPAPTAAVALGRALTAGVLLGALLKGRQRLALKFEGSGPLEKIVVQADAHGGVHGYVAHPDVDLPLRHGRFDVAGALGAGVLTVTKDLLLKTPYQGVVHLVSAEIGEDVAYYLTESEQIPSAVGVTTIPDAQGGVRAAGGFLIQSLPPANMDAIDAVLQRIQTIPPLGRILQDAPSAQGLLERIFHGMDMEILETSPVAFRCSCSEQRIAQALKTLGRDALLRLAADEETIAIRCEFCGEEYRFSAHQLRELVHQLPQHPHPESEPPAA
ncbi:MAG: Hsp33 family molecular chaperone HslO [Desulfomicrobiaceae bacterium]